jgi:hypothetical protein
MIRRRRRKRRRRRRRRIIIIIIIIIFVAEVYIGINSQDVYPFISVVHVDIQTLPIKGTC